MSGSVPFGLSLALVDKVRHERVYFSDGTEMYSCYCVTSELALAIIIIAIIIRVCV